MSVETQNKYIVNLTFASRRNRGGKTLVSQKQIHCLAKTCRGDKTMRVARKTNTGW